YINYLVVPEGKSIKDEIDTFPKYDLPWMNVTTYETIETKTTSIPIIEKHEDKLDIYLIIVLTMLIILSIIILISIFKRFRSKRNSEKLYLY
ncbi:MAG: hypothetical protein QXY18_06510, partial [Nitrososphaerota archaeon]